MLCFVVLPSGIVYDVCVGQKSKGQQLLEKICELLGLSTELDYFGLKYVKGEEELWLNLRNGIEKNLGEVAKFYLRVKFWTAPHLVLLESTRHLMYTQIINELKSKKLKPNGDESKKRIFSLICNSESQDCSWSVEKLRFWAKLFDQDPKFEPETPPRKKAVEEYWVLKEVSKFENYGEELFDIKGMKIGIGPHGIRIYSPKEEMIPYSAIKSTSSLRRHFELHYINSDHIEDVLEIKCCSVASASELYRSLTERHDFYSCDTVRSAVTSQYVRDLKGTIASIFNESTPLGKKYVFDIQKTCREVHDSARRALYTPVENKPQTKQQDAEYRLAGIIDSFTCRVCMDRQIDTVFFPCAHVITCLDCAPRLEFCPVCRTQVEKFNKLFLPQIRA
ncbi:E3 ubiquitin-protein ligase MYLIP-A [Cimex lectularius]|uniref:RING-type domain-containing protein n=1 Tax=Cimex lectularius TaxID=79782 RepID=A0A8I6S700_CIMLE|nr:E3 ubiquitin-protein ligase MYLIP-A [Cimex lectularius]